MTLSEAALGDANELMQQARELMLSAGNASYSDAERKGLANKLQGLRDQLLSIANRPDGSGGYLFSGQGPVRPRSWTKPPACATWARPAPSRPATSTTSSSPWTAAPRGEARSGNGSFVTSAANALTSLPAKGWIDSGRVTDPSQLTGNNYRIDIAGTPPAQTYSVTNVDTGAGVAAGTFLPNTTIAFDGMAVGISNNATDGDTFNIAPATNDLRVSTCSTAPSRS